MTDVDIAAVQDHLAMLRINNLVPTRHGILQKLLDANGAPANAMTWQRRKMCIFAPCGWRSHSPSDVMRSYRRSRRFRGAGFPRPGATRHGGFG
jgi:hypothetical protein